RRSPAASRRRTNDLHPPQPRRAARDDRCARTAARDGDGLVHDEARRAGPRRAVEGSAAGERRDDPERVEEGGRARGHAGKERVAGRRRDRPRDPDRPAGGDRARARGLLAEGCREEPGPAFAVRARLGGGVDRVRADRLPHYPAAGAERGGGGEGRRAARAPVHRTARARVAGGGAGRPGTPRIARVIDREQVLHVAKLARLRLTDEEVERMSGELSTILEAIEQIGELDLEGV